MAAIACVQCTNLLAFPKIPSLALTGLLVVAAMSVASSAHAQVAQQTSSGMQITLPASTGSQAVAPAKNREDDAQDQLLSQAVQMIKSGQPADALAGPVAQVIAYYENGVGKDHSQRHCCARSMVEVLLYTAGAAKDHQSAEVLTQTWASAYFYESSALTDLGRIVESQAALRKAIALSPWNSLYLSELAYTYEMQHDNEKALDLFTQAEGLRSFLRPSRRIPNSPTRCEVKVTP